MNGKSVVVEGSKKYILSDRDYDLLFYLARNNKYSQRDISSQLGFSLGLTNIIIKKMIKMGYVKTKHLSKSRMQYLLTAKGFFQATKKSYNFLLKTINSVKLIKDKVVEITNQSYDNNRKKFVIIGINELADIVEIALRSTGKNDIEIIRCEEYKKQLFNGSLILDTTGSAMNTGDNENCVNLYKVLSHTLV